MDYKQRNKMTEQKTIPPPLPIEYKLILEFEKYKVDKALLNEFKKYCEEKKTKNRFRKIQWKVD